MKPFEELKEIITAGAKENDACADQYKRALASTTEAELLQVVFDNLNWYLERKIVSHELFAEFTPEIYLASGIANTGKENTGYINSGNWNSGYRNSGDRNSGNWNSGYRNSGYRNSGNRNSGDWNSGNRNSGDRNSGDRNSGDRNSGNRNSGYRNSGDRNSGNWNSGNRNSGDSNSGYRNSGAFCTEPNPKLVLFDQLTDINVKDWENMRPCQIMNEYLIPNIFVWESEMTEKEKEEHPHSKTTEGYLKSIPMQDAWANMWGNLTDENKKEFTSLPFFSADKFFQITGIKID